MKSASQGEGFFVGLYMVLVGFAVDGEHRSFFESLSPTTRSLQGAEFSGEPRGRAGEGDSPGFEGG